MGKSNRDPQANRPVVSAVRESDPGCTIDLEVVSNQVGEPAIERMPGPALGIKRDIPKQFSKQTCSVAETNTQDGGIVEE